MTHGGNMKKLLLVPIVLALAACSSTPTVGYAPVRSIDKVTSPIKDPVQNEITKGYGQIPEFEARALTRSEVITASDQCRTAGMRPFVEYVTQRTEFGRVLTAVNVHCNPIR